MKATFRTTLLAAALLLAASSGFAQEATGTTWMTAARSALTRADVIADLAAARVAGFFKATGLLWASSLGPRGTVTVRLADGTEISLPPTTRDALRDEVLRLRASGELARLNAEAYEFRPVRAAS